MRGPSALPRFPFSAVVGHDDVKLALVLNAVDPAIGGVLLRGQKGSAKSTLARGLAPLLGDEAPFVELPVGATEDRVAGTLDLTAALTGGERRFLPGLLAAADGGVLYVDEVNLLPDHLVDLLLDVAASGVNRVERESVSHEHPSRFVLVGSMNPEEGDLRPQLLDRFGLAVDVLSSTDPTDRAEAVERRMAFDADPAGFAARWAGAEGDLGRRVARARPVAVPSALVRRVSSMCASVGAEGLRADLVICRAAAALAGWDGRATPTVDDVRRVAPLALAHRRRRSPLDDAGIDRDEIDAALGRSDEPADDAGDDGDAQERVAEPDAPTAVDRLAPARDRSGRSDAAGRRSLVESSRGRLVGDRPVDPGGPMTASAGIAVGATVRAAAARRAGPRDAEPGDGDEPLVAPGDLRLAVREQRTGNLVVLCVDASGSMGGARRMEAAKGAVRSLLLDAYQRRDRVALVTFRDRDAEVVLRPTGSVEVARARLGDLPTGGRTPLAAGIEAGLAVATAPTPATLRPLLVLVSDGRATAGPPDRDPMEAALEAAAGVGRRGVGAVVVDAEDGPARLGLARRLAEAMRARYVTVPELSAGALDRTIRDLVP